MNFDRILAIENLPQAASSLLKSRIYVVVHEEDVPILTVTWPTMLKASRLGPVIWVTERDPDRELALQAADTSQMRDALASGRIRSFLWGGSALPRLQRILMELDYFGGLRGGLVVVDGVDRFFDNPGLGDAAAIMTECHRWVERHACALLLLCTRRAGRADPVDTLQGVTHHLAGFARFRRIAGGLVWDVFHWLGASGGLADRSLRLDVHSDGHLMVAQDQPSKQLFEPVTDEDVVYITRAAVTVKRPPMDWCVIESIDALMAATAATIAATIVLDYDASSSLDALARAVYSLRQSRGNRIKIVVREVNMTMRYSQEQLMLRAGANLVVSPEVTFSRFMGLVDMVQGQVFSRPLAPDYETAAMAVTTVSEKGYLTPPAFAQTVTAIMERSRVLDIQSVLVSLPLVRGLSPSDALRYCTVRRSGDLCTADSDSVHVFFFACRENSIGIALDRLFRLPVAELFEGEERYLSWETIQQAVEKLAQWASGAGWSDLGDVYSAGPAVAAQAVAVPARNGAHHASLPARRCPLPVRRSCAGIPS